MKALYMLIISFVLCLNSCTPKVTKDERIRLFLTDLKKPDWKFDEIYSQHIQFETPPGEMPGEIMKILLSTLSELSLAMQNTKSSDIKIIKYPQADSSLKRMNIDEDYQKRTYIVQVGSLRKYILLNDNNKILTWVQFQEQAFWKF